jgi:hypothetical protein
MTKFFFSFFQIGIELPQDYDRGGPSPNPYRYLNPI